MDHHQRPNLKDYAALAATMVGVAALGVMVFGMSFVPEDFETRFTVATWIVTAPVGLVTIILLFWRNNINQQEFRETVKSGYADRFKTGAELLAATEEVVKVSGIIVLRELALEQPEQYGVIVADLLTDYVNTAGHEQWAASPNFANSGTNSEQPARRKYTRPPAYFKAFTSLGQLNASATVREQALRMHLDRRVEFYKTSLEGVNVRRRNYNDCIFFQVEFESAGFNHCELAGGRFVRCHFEGAAFFDCKMNGAIIRGVRSASTGSIEFANCDLSQANFQLFTYTVEIENCDLTGAKIIGHQADIDDCWARGTPPTLVGFQKNVTIWDADGPGEFVTTNGVVNFVPGAECPFWIYLPGMSAQYIDPVANPDDTVEL